MNNRKSSPCNWVDGRKVGAGVILFKKNRDTSNRISKRKITRGRLGYACENRIHCARELMYNRLKYLFIDRVIQE